MLESREMKVLRIVSPWDMKKGMKPFQEKEGDFDGLLFVFPGYTKAVFTGRGMKRSVLLCSLDKVEGKHFKKNDCVCLKPEEEVEVEGRYFLERLASDNCNELYTFGTEDKQ